jgi:hypothetical protein
MSDKKQEKAIGRRAFFGAVGGAAAAGAATLVAGPAAAQAEASDEMRRARYTESDHVKMFYRVNGYETKK